MKEKERKKDKKKEKRKMRVGEKQWMKKSC